MDLYTNEMEQSIDLFEVRVLAFAFLILALLLSCRSVLALGSRPLKQFINCGFSLDLLELDQIDPN